MIQPLRARASARTALDLAGDVGHRPGDQDLVGGAEVGAPVDVAGPSSASAVERAGARRA